MCDAVTHLKINANASWGRQTKAEDSLGSSVGAAENKILKVVQIECGLCVIVCLYALISQALFISATPYAALIFFY